MSEFTDETARESDRKDQETATAEATSEEAPAPGETSRGRRRPRPMRRPHAGKRHGGGRGFNCCH